MASPHISYYSVGPGPSTGASFDVAGTGNVGVVIKAARSDPAALFRVAYSCCIFVLHDRAKCNTEHLFSAVVRMIVRL